MQVEGRVQAKGQGMKMYAKDSMVTDNEESWIKKAAGAGITIGVGGVRYARSKLNGSAQHVDS